MCRLGLQVGLRPLSHVQLDYHDTILALFISLTQLEQVPILGLCWGYFLLLRWYDFRCCWNPWSFFKDFDALFHSLVTELLILNPLAD